ncbi:aminodeoxychorismate synthase component I [Propionibacteriaceae bacterium Y1685]
MAWRNSGAARFDDARAGTSWQFGPPEELIIATRIDEVAGALSRVEQASAAGRWCVGMVSYDASPAFDSSLSVIPADPDGPPLVWFAVCDDPEVDQGPPDAATAYRIGSWQWEWTREDHDQRVETVRQAISAGDTYQCNLTTRVRAAFDGAAEALYADLIMQQAASHHAWLDLGRFTVISASPESFFTWHEDTVTCRPMKGTAERCATVEADREQQRQLLDSAKDRAENLMIVDLIRNDLSRVAIPGTVAVSELFTREAYPTVWQLTSTVTAQVPERTTLTDLFSALFPCGSITGAPKSRTTELITALESSPRGPYCGAIGWVAPSHHRTRARFSVAIRTAVLDRNSEVITYGTGGGITWDSRSAAEWNELRAKTRVLDRAGDWQLLETLRCRDERPQHLDDHLDRLMASAAHFGIPVDRRCHRRSGRTRLHGSHRRPDSPRRWAIRRAERSGHPRADRHRSDRAGSRPPAGGLDLGVAAPQDHPP